MRFRTAKRGDIVMSKHSNRSRHVAFAALPLVLGLCTLACGSGSGAGSTETTARTGSIDLALTAGPITLNFVSYAIENGSSGFYKAGVIDVTSSTKLSATIGGIPAGTGYYIRLTAAAANDAYATCTGWAFADIVAGSTTSTNIVLSCKTSATTGSVKIHGSINLCPTIASLSIEPAQTTVGHGISLTAAGDDPDNGPSPLSYRWDSTGGTIADPESANTTFTCTEARSEILYLYVTDGDPACGVTQAQIIDCAASDADGGSGGSSGGGAGGSAGASQSGDDPSTPGDDGAGYVACEDTANVHGLVCKPGFYCCSSTESCVETANDCINGFGAQTCDGPEDCNSGLVCQRYKATGCEVASDAVQYTRRCHHDADCPMGKSCNSSGDCGAQR